MSDVFYSTVYHINKDGEFQCNQCSETRKSVRAAGTHFIKCEESEGSENERRELLKKDTKYRGNHSTKGKTSKSKYNKSDKGKESKSKYKKSDKGKATESKYHKSDKEKAANSKYENSDKGKATRKAWAQSARGRFSVKKAMDRHYSKFPWLRKAQREALKLLGKFGHRFKKTSNVNRGFKLKFDNLLKSKQFRAGLRHSGIRAGEVIEMGMLKGQINISKYVQIMAGIRKSFSEIDSSASNYVYLLCDPELWEDDMHFDEFLDSIFYVGRGIGARFLDHVRAAQIIVEDDFGFDPEQCPKEARIIENWLEGKDVKVVCINLDNYAEKTDFIEFAINAFLGSQLTNKKLDGVTKTPADFDVDQVSDTALHFLASAFNNRTYALPRSFDDDFGKKPIYQFQD